MTLGIFPKVRTDLRYRIPKYRGSAKSYILTKCFFGFFYLYLYANLEKKCAIIISQKMWDLPPPLQSISETV